ncbi:MAG: AMP-binding protein, partial [Polymorphobacter sp.]
MLNGTATCASAPAAGLVPTPTLDRLERRLSDFATLGEALDYAATGGRGFNFFDARATLVRAYPFAELRADAILGAHRLIAAGVKPGDRVALIAETSAEFAQLFFAAIYAAALPTPLPLPTSFGGRDAYVDQIRTQLNSCDPVIVLAPEGLFAMVAEAAEPLAGCAALDWREFLDQPAAAPAVLPAAAPEDIAYLQYSSGSTRFPHGVMVTHRALLANLSGHAISMQAQPTDRVVSWLPWYHDMGLVGCMLTPVSNQLSADFIATDDFARRPLSWMALVSRNEGT